MSKQQENNMKPFSLEEALSGAPVCTRDGRPVTQLVKFDTSDYYSLAGVVDGAICIWTDNGKYLPSVIKNRDLFMAPVKKTGWVARYMYGHGKGFYINGVIFDSEEDVKAAEPNASSYHEISWEE